MNKDRKMAITQRAALGRMSRVLAKDRKIIRAMRGKQAREQLGSYAIISLRSNTVVRANFDLEKEARSIGCLEGWERIK